MKKTVLIVMSSLMMVSCYKDNTQWSTSHECGFITQKGTQCKNIVTDGHQYCWQHR